MESELFEQAIDILTNDDKIKKKVFDPIRRRILPYVLTWIIFNFILILLILNILYKLNT